MMEMKRPALPLTGGCPCEAVRFEVSAMQLLVYACHCTECQRWSGSAFSMSMPVASKSFRVVRGEPKPWRRIGASSLQSTYWFCGDCGGRVYGDGTPAPISGLSAPEPGCVKTLTFNLRVEIPSRFCRCENQLHFPALSREGN